MRASPVTFVAWKSISDTVLMVNVLEHVPDEQQALKNLWTVLRPGGRVVILVPEHPALYGTLDESPGASRTIRR